MFKKIGLLLVILLMAGCASEHHQKRQAHFQKWIEANGKVKILSTIAMINDLVMRIGGDHVDTMTLIQGELDPHSYQLVKGDDEKLTFAHIIFYNGLGLEHGPSLHRYLSDSSKTYSLGDLLNNQHPELILNNRGQKDPHIWMDISLWAKTIPFIVEALSQQDPTHAAAYQFNARQLKSEMERMHQQVKDKMHEVSADKRYLVTSHDAFYYFARAYLAEEGEAHGEIWRKRFASPEGLAPESQLSVSDIKAVINFIKQNQITVLFPESNVSKDSIRKIVRACQEEGRNIEIADCHLYGDALGEPGSQGDTYLKMIFYNASTLVDYMNK